MRSSSLFLSRLARASRRLTAAAGGNVAMIFALALPPIAVAAVGGIQLSYVVNTRSVSQDVADSAALAGAQQMAVSPVGAADRAVSWAKAQLASRASSSTFQVTALAVDNHTLKVAVDAYTPSFFGDMLPKGGFKSHAEATGQQQALAPLCVLIDGGAGDQLKLTGTSQLSGTCLVHGNGDVQADAAAAISASRVEAGGAARGPITPAPMTGAPTVQDPFASLPIPPQSCIGVLPDPPYLSGGTYVIPPGVHGLINVGNNAIVKLSPGEHYFCDKLILGNNGHFDGTDVVLVFQKNAQFLPGSNANISISGRQSGALAGFVWITARDMTSPFSMSTDPFSSITGAIYVPGTELNLVGTRSAAASSDWTVIAAKALKVSGQARLQINTNYAGSSVSVPIGIGDKAAANSPVRIVR